MSYGIVGVPYDVFMVTFHPQCRDAIGIQSLTLDNIRRMKEEYLESEDDQTEILGLTPVIVAKLEPLKWSYFKSSMIKYFSRVHGGNNTPISYIVRRDNTGVFEGYFETRMDRLIACIVLRGAKLK